MVHRTWAEKTGALDRVWILVLLIRVCMNHMLMSVELWDVHMCICLHAKFYD